MPSESEVREIHALLDRCGVPRASGDVARAAFDRVAMLAGVSRGEPIASADDIHAVLDAHDVPRIGSDAEGEVEFGLLERVEMLVGQLGKWAP